MPLNMSDASGPNDNDGYEFTVPNDVLTKEQRDFYEKNGYIVFKKLIPQEDLDRYKRHFQKLCSGEAPRVPTMTVMRDVSIKHEKSARGEHMITKIQDFQDDPEIFAYCQTPELLDIVAAFTGPNVKSIHSMLINKPPNVGDSGRHPFHQDLYYFPMRPANRIVAAWTAMERIDRTNGCLSVIAGSHKGPLLPHGYPEWDGKVNKAYHGILNYPPPDNRIHLVMEPGDTVFFHPLLIHGSGSNKSAGYRKAISCHFASADCEFIDVKGTIQEPIALEIEDMGHKKTGVPLTFNEVWLLKSRLLRGAYGKMEQL